MTNEEWQNSYNKLKGIYSEFLIAYGEYQKGKNKKTRDSGYRKAGYIIDRAIHHIFENNEIYLMLTGHEKSDFGRAVVTDEFMKPHYFINDMDELLDKINSKIRSFNN